MGLRDRKTTFPASSVYASVASVRRPSPDHAKRVRRMDNAVLSEWRENGGSMTSRADALTERLFSAAVATFDLAGVYLGDRLGWYRSLASDGPATADELAARTSTDARYALEWLEQQAVGGILEVDAKHRFSLPEEHAAALIDPESLNLMAPMSRMMTAAIGQLPRLVEAYRTGDGVGWESYGADMREGQANFNRPAFTHPLGAGWLPAIADLPDR